jgi:DNA-binding GntR family transcriptional regulator
MSVATYSLRQQAYDRIRELLRAGQLGPGEKLSTLELSRRLGISRTPIREALSKLASDGVVREVRGFGAYVHQPDEGELIEVYGLREALESHAAREAAQRITDDELDQLERLCTRWLAIARELQASGAPCLDAKAHGLTIRIDEKFHATLIAAARSKLLYKAIDDMRLMSRTLVARRPEGERVITLSMVAKTYRDHATLLRALRRRDADAAEHWMRHQLSMGREHHIRFLRQAQRATAGEANDSRDRRKDSRRA